MSLQFVILETSSVGAALGGSVVFCVSLMHIHSISNKFCKNKNQKTSICLSNNQSCHSPWNVRIRLGSKCMLLLMISSLTGF